MAMQSQELAQWLFDNGGPIVRYLTATELLEDTSGIDLEQLVHDLLACDEVQRWLDNLGAGPIHHSRDTAAENALAKLCEYGLQAGIPALDEKALPYCDLSVDKSYYDFEVILVPFLIRAGYWREQAIRDWFIRRLADLQRTAQHGSYDLYMDEKERAGFPKPWAEKQFYKLEFNPTGDAYPLPSCYDLYGMAYWPADDLETWQAIEAVAAYVIDPAFQTTPGGYIWNPVKRQGYAAGRVFLACFPILTGFDPERFESNRFVMFVELGARFEAVRGSQWFRDSIAHLEQFCTPGGTYRFPAPYLQEKRNSYYLYAGAHMGLGENRRGKSAIEIESTFRLLRIKKQC
ncbi:MAG: hypothetical protein JXA89_04505 [Anaerolineae bacterium]|nr:hypothetical protein [Anaerolineae bacterium]